jgi:hypothetical protein
VGINRYATPALLAKNQLNQLQSVEDLDDATKTVLNNDVDIQITDCHNVDNMAENVDIN